MSDGPHAKRELEPSPVQRVKPTDLTEEQAKRLVAGDFGEASLKHAASFVVPLFWVWRDASGESKLNNGSAFFVRTPKRLFGVTANHVHEGFIRARESFRTSSCHLLPMSFDEPRTPIKIDLTERLIARSAECDICTFAVTEGEIRDLEVSVIDLWPAMLPQEGRGIVFAGYPGHERRFVSFRLLEFSPFPGLAVATTVNDRHISCHLDRDYLVKTKGFSVAPEHYETGGMSGGPLFTVEDKPSGLQVWRLAGVITEGLSQYDLLLASRADCLRADGSIADR